jgi:hypothetical protein
MFTFDAQYPEVMVLIQPDQQVYDWYQEKAENPVLQE